MIKKKVDLFIEKARTLLTPIEKLPTENLLPKTEQLFPKTEQESLLTPAKETPFVYTQPNQYFKGDLNPIEKRVVTRGICIDTLFRSNYFTTSSTDFMYEFPEYYKNVVYLKITALEIPKNWYSFSKEHKSNSFTVNNTIIEIPDGNYQSTDMVTTINNLTSIVEFTISSITGKCTFYSSIPFTMSFKVEAIPLNMTMGWNLGFRKESYSSININGRYEVTSESFYGSTFDNYIFIEMDDFQRNFITDSIVSKKQNGYIGNNIIARIPISNNYNTLNVTNSSDKLFKERNYLGPVRLEKLHIRILDRFGRVIQINNSDYSMMLEIQQLIS